ncbi:DsbA family protein [Microbacterium elymi]|uniref:DsbA family protein n=1 Tax=Microbacterium elymi TaxID=2909587 RepID=A0ABY5NL73_9MICO|nr:DsbA family protein [Microbacterium elymi]UUT35910.1 DsbA family protein [Microbacterium elymi]
MAAVVVLIAVTGVVIAINNASSGPGAEPSGDIINTDAGTVSFGDGTNTIDTYIDFLCPYCNQFEQSVGPTIDELVKGGTVTLNVHPVTILDGHSSPAGYSSRSASAFFAVAAADPDKAYAFMQALFANQPAEGSAGLTNEQIVDLAKQAGVSMTDDLEKAITSDRYQKYALAQSLPAGATGTPHLEVNGEAVAVTMDPAKDITAHLK